MNTAQLFSNWYFLAPVALALFSMVIGLARSRQAAGFELFLAFLASAGFGFFAWRTYGSIILALIVLIYGYLWIGTRWNNWVREKYKFSRLL